MTTRPNTPNVAIGIDLGTKISLAAICHSEGVGNTNNSEGPLSGIFRIASNVTISNSKRLVGQLAAANDKIKVPDTANIAWRYAYPYSKNGVCVSDAKRLIGCKFDDPNVQEYVKYLPFDVVDAGGKAKIRVKSRGRLETFSPEEIVSMVLAKFCKKTIANFCRPTALHAVISVPSGFNDAQRQAMRDAAMVAGLYVPCLINDTSAAALAYISDLKLQKEQKILIFDFGGGSLSVSISIVKEKSFQVIASVGDAHLGGEDFNNRLINYAIDQFKDKYNRDISKNREALAQLKVAAECAKQILSTETATKFVISSLDSGIDFSFEITRPRFEMICADLFTDAINLVREVLCDVDLNKDDIQDVVLVGGCSHIPMVQTSLQDFFCGKALNLSFLLSDTVVCGAAIQAAILFGQSSDVKDFKLVDVAPRSLGIAIADGSFYKVIERNTPIPCRTSVLIHPPHQNYLATQFRIFEGECNVAKHNNYLGRLLLTDIPATPRKKVKISVTFELATSGVLQVTAKEKNSGYWTDTIVRNEEGRLSQKEFDKMSRRQMEFLLEEEEQQKKILITDTLKYEISKLKFLLNDVGDQFSESVKKFYKKVGDDILRWLNENSEVGFIELHVKLKHLQRCCMEISKLID